MIPKYLIMSRNALWIQFHLQPIRRSRCASFFSWASADNVICIPELRVSERKESGCSESSGIIAAESVTADLIPPRLPV